MVMKREVRVRSITEHGDARAGGDSQKNEKSAARFRVCGQS